MLVGQPTQNAPPAHALVLRGIAEQHHTRVGIARPLEQLTRLRGTQRPGLVDHEHRVAFEPWSLPCPWSAGDVKNAAARRRESLANSCRR